ncbi:MAG: nodulation protein NfeD, partial [Bacilli bacterium]|nr:nodulation protein NfeD [Bacilli bacterium]
MVRFRNPSMFVLSAFFVFLLMFPASLFGQEGEGKLVYVIPVEKEVERGLEAFLKRAVDEAMEEGANHIIFEIDTPGGRVDSAGQIGKLLKDIDVPTTAFIVNNALSAGSYIALNLDTIYMKPNATMGASGVITADGNAADKKAQSAWIAAMKSAAEASGRDPIYAIAMADESIDLPELNKPPGEFLTLTANDALKVGYAEGIVNNREELLHALQLTGAKVVEAETTLAEEIARFVTNPIVIPILLSIASIGLIAELYTPGFGIAGTMSLIALFLFFYGHIIAGLAGLEAIVLFIIGLILVILELFVPGGILGIIGGIAIVASVFIAGYDFTFMAISILIAFMAALVTFIIFYRSVGLEKGLFRKLILRDR